MDWADGWRKSLYLPSVEPLVLSMLVNSVLGSEPSLVEVGWSQKLGQSKFFGPRDCSKASGRECGGTRL
jgi:hypothetical protein